MEINNNYKYIKYNDYWQNSLQRLESITNNLEQNFSLLEKQYYNFDKFYSEIIAETDILAAAVPASGRCQFLSPAKAE